MSVRLIPRRRPALPAKPDAAHRVIILERIGDRATWRGLNRPQTYARDFYTLCATFARRGNLKQAVRFWLGALRAEGKKASNPDGIE